jgi:hypothetical protein
MDFELRDQELGLKSSSSITAIHSNAANERDFSEKIRKQLPKLDLSDTDITNLYKAINGLRGVINSPDDFLSKMHAFISPSTLSIISTSQVN